MTWISESAFYKQAWQEDHHVTGIFPDDTNLTCTLTTHADQHTWCAWTEIADSATTKLSACFDTFDGQIAGMVIESVSDITIIYMLEVAYGDAKTVITRWRFAGETKFLNPAHEVRVRSALIPAGETVYYRLKSEEDASEDTALVHFRYFLHE